MLVVFSVIFLFRSIFSNPSIDLRNCQPNSFISKIKRAYVPLVFSVQQHISLENFINSSLTSEGIDLCVRIHSNNTNEKNACIDLAYQQLNNAKTCYEFWSLQCKSNGGRC
jgi:hypothetical protein